MYWFCLFHKCWKITKKKYCDQHRCQFKKCRNSVSPLVQYCSAHKCLMVPCGRPSILGECFCSIHKMESCKMSKWNIFIYDVEL